MTLRIIVTIHIDIWRQHEIFCPARKTLIPEKTKAGSHREELSLAARVILNSNREQRITLNCQILKRLNFNLSVNKNVWDTMGFFSAYANNNSLCE